MGFRRVTKKFLKYLIPILVILLIIPVSETGRRIFRKSDPSGSKRLRCAIQLGTLDKLSNGYLTGYHYELLSIFAKSIGDSADISLGNGIAAGIDSVRSGKLDIFVVPSGEVPAENDGLDLLALEDSSIVWITRPVEEGPNRISYWFSSFQGSDRYPLTRARFFSCYNPYNKTSHKNKAILSPYDDCLKQYAKIPGWDWKLLAALAWNESKFRIQVHSSKGAGGIMQMVPGTAANYGVRNILDPRESIEAGAKYIARLQALFKEYAAGEEELVKFTLAAYNAGEGRILDCIRFAESQGTDAGRWDSICKVMPKMDSDSAAVSEELRLGKFNGAETRAYVRMVLNQYDLFRGQPPRYHLERADTLELKIEEDRLLERDAIDVLMGPDSLSRVNLGDEETRNQEEEHDDDERDDVGGYDNGQVQVNRNE